MAHGDGEIGVDERRAWRIGYWVLFSIFLLTAALNMSGVSAGFLTNHAADLFLPPWLYIVLRGLTGGAAPKLQPLRWVGAWPARTALSLFFASSLTELSQLLWPDGFFRGTFDPLDIGAYAAGLTCSYLVEKIVLRRGGLRSQESPATP